MEKERGDMTDPVSRVEKRRTEPSGASASDPLDTGDWLESERALQEVQLGARLLREMRAKGIFKGTDR
jgi:hypothetical protein